MSEESPVIATLYFKDPLVRATGRLIVAENPDGDADVDEAHVVQLREGRTIRLGRAKSNDIVMQNSNVSRFHAVFSASASGVVLSDLSSLNGTLVNGSRISTPVDISSGDIVSIGDAEISVKMAVGTGETGETSQGRTQTAQMTSVMVTVLVVDVCGYSKLSEKLPPSDVAEMMHRWFQAISNIVRDHDGEIDKYIGDCVMALWRGGKADVVQGARRAVTAGVRMLAATEALSQNGQWSHHSEFPWHCRIAVNTGEALMGGVGGAERRDFTVLGDTVNVAFLLEELAGKSEKDFVVSAKTASLVEGEVPLSRLNTISISGRAEEIEVFSVGEE